MIAAAPAIGRKRFSGLLQTFAVFNNLARKRPSDKQMLTTT